MNTSVFKKWLVAGCLLITAGGASAQQSLLDDAFGSLTGAGGYSAAQGARAYNGTLRSGVDFGSGRVVTGVSRSRVNLVNFTPPQATAGCGGIDFHLGGISWVNWDQFSELLDSVLLSAQYAVVNIALDYISEKLGATFKAVMNALQEATNMEIDACKLGKDLVSAAANKFGVAPTPSDRKESFCHKELLDTNTADGFGSAGEVCKNLAFATAKAADVWKDLKATIGLSGSMNADGTKVTAGTDPNKSDAVATCGGNCTWITLRASGFAPKNISTPPSFTAPADKPYFSGVAVSELIMSGIGYNFSDDASQASGNPDLWDRTYGNKVGPRFRSGTTLSPQNFIAILLCGSNYILNTTEAAIIAPSTAASLIAADPTLTQSMNRGALALIKAQCEQLKLTGSGASTSTQVKVITCMSASDVPAYIKAETDTSVLDGTSGLPISATLNGAAFQSAKELCQWPVAIPIRTWANQSYVKDTLLGEGLLQRNLRVMESIFSKLISGNEALTPAEEIPFILTAPTPVYQMLSLASLFPSQGLEMVYSQALMITAIQAQAILDRLISDAARNTNESLPVSIDELAQITQLFDGITKAFGSVNLSVDTQLNRMLAFQGQVKILQGAVLDSVYGRGLLGNLAFSTDVSAITGSP